jgi:hypothetical protein
MHINPIFLETIIFIEICLTVFIIIMTYVLKLIYTLREKNRQILMREVENYFNKLIAEKNIVDLSKFENKWKRLDIIMPAYPKLNNNFENNLETKNNWIIIKENFLKSIVIPLAKKNAMKRSWIERCYAAEAMIVLTDRIEEKYLIKLIEDKIPVIYLNAVNAAITQRSEIAIGLIIKLMSHKRKMSQANFLQAFDDPPDETRLIVEKFLIISEDIYERATCYTILLKYPEKKLTWNIDSDIHSNNKELKMAALRYLTFADKEAAFSAAIQLLEDQAWEVRVAAIHTLGALNKDSALSNLTKGLHDPIWWVRINAAQVLFKLGEKGIEILKSQDPAVDKFSYDVAKQVLSTIS